MEWEAVRVGCMRGKPNARLSQASRMHRETFRWNETNPLHLTTSFGCFVCDTSWFRLSSTWRSSTWQTCLVVFLRRSRRILQYYLDTCHDGFLPNTYPANITNHFKVTKQQAIRFNVCINAVPGFLLLFGFIRILPYRFPWQTLADDNWEIHEQDGMNN